MPLELTFHVYLFAAVENSVKTQFRITRWNSTLKARYSCKTHENSLAAMPAISGDGESKYSGHWRKRVQISARARARCLNLCLGNNKKLPLDWFPSTGTSLNRAWDLFVHHFVSQQEVTESCMTRPDQFPIKWLDILVKHYLRVKIEFTIDLLPVGCVGFPGLWVWIPSHAWTDHVSFFAISIDVVGGRKVMVFFFGKKSAMSRS